MAFYELSKAERLDRVAKISDDILNGLKAGQLENIHAYFNHEDTYIRKSTYLSIGRIERLFLEPDFRIRQTVINAAGEIGKSDFEVVSDFFDLGLFDTHHSPRNAVIGSIKKMGVVNPVPVLNWAKLYLHHEDKEIRREICHGIELRVGRIAA